MTPQTILTHHDSGQLWTQAQSNAVEFDVAADLIGGHIVTTGTLTDAWPVQSGEQWMGEFDAPLSGLTVLFD